MLLETPPFSGAQWKATPELFLIRWFSFAEQQSYEAVIKLKNVDEIVEKMKEVAPFEGYGEIAERPQVIESIARLSDKLNNKTNFCYGTLEF